MITISDLAKSFAGQTLFEQASLQLQAGNRYGVVGANGSGKSTLLRIIAGQETASVGEITLPRRAVVGVLEQDHFQYEDVPILHVVMMGHAEVWEAMRLKEELLSAPPDELDVDRYSEVEDTILRLDGYALEARAAEILEGMQIPTAQHHNPLSSLSGGYKLRVLLARTLAGEPDILLLDEPNNHLDIVSLQWLERFLCSYRGCAVIVSHDHQFLDNVCTHILDVDYQRVMQYRGNYSRFEEQKVAERERQEKEIEKREKEIADHKAFVDRFRAKATKARQANSRQKRMDKIEIAELAPSSRRYPRFSFPQRRPSGREVLEAIGLSKRYGDKQVLEGVDLTVHRGDKLAVIGPNGIGKSTLLKGLVGDIDLDEGLVTWGYETHIGYFAQDHHEALSDGTATVASWLWEHLPGVGVGEIYARLAQVLFSRDEADKRLEHLSGGEAARLVLASLTATEPNVLVLDEPTNHLDLEGIEALAGALQDTDSTVLLVSHDRWFVSQVATRIVEITADGVDDFRGTYAERLARDATDHLDRHKALEQARQGRRKGR